METVRWQKLFFDSYNWLSGIWSVLVVDPPKVKIYTIQDLLNGLFSYHVSLPLETLVSWSIVVILRFLGFYAACVPSVSSHQFRISKLIQQASNGKPLKGVVGVSEGLKQEKDRKFLKLFRSEQNKRKKDSQPWCAWNLWLSNTFPVISFLGCFSSFRTLPEAGPPCR